MAFQILVIEPSQKEAAQIEWILGHESVLLTKVAQESEIRHALDHHAFKLIIADANWLYYNQFPIQNWIVTKNALTPVLLLLETETLPHLEHWLLDLGYDYILKPIRPQDLLLRTNKHLKKQSTKTLLIMPQAEIEELAVPLTQEGFTVLTTSTKPEALRFLESHRPQSVVIDACLGESVVHDLFSHISSMTSFSPHTFLYATSAELSQYPGLLTIHADETLLKPIWSKDFILRLKRALKNTDKHITVTPSFADIPQAALTKELQTEKEKFLQQIQVTLHHEIRNPLTSILIGSQALTHQFKEGSPEKEVLSGIEKCSRRIKDVMDSLGNLKQFVVDDYVGDIQMINLAKSKEAPESFQKAAGLPS